MRWFREWRLGRWKRRYKGFQQATAQVDAASYHVRELTVAERMAFREYVAENQGDQTLALAWLAHTACWEFARMSILRLATSGPPTALARVSTAVLDVSGMVPDDEPAFAGAEPGLDDGDTTPGTVQDAKKNSADLAN